MYAIVETGGKQYRVTAGQVLRVEKVPGNKGQEVVFEKVLFISNGKETKIGKPYVEGAIVKGTIIKQGKAKKVIVFRFKRRKRYHKKRGHRQYFTAVKIDEIKM